MRKHKRDKDRDEIVPDGGAIRVRMIMMDGVEQMVSEAVARDYEARAGARRPLVDAHGRPPGHAPGYVFEGGPDADAARARRDAVLATRDAMLAGAWRSSPANRTPTTAEAARDRYVRGLANAWRAPR